ncbi:efflux RND transporter periplasmic adaptor subunit [Solimicrobium silvestre]|uniref:Efflux transporter, RND family, MFP subunit n=1 Tax=Solimicrobium silvestre TaxID=2099400 RepID=A0A2S9H4Z2_9BURK|nr:efflux RND transporter periplasmic adaptor subunit [Solimicrobium silvestre]PRC94946.1 Efflux transporter, RND family, MFP subunit [Solimicrobium silvestre]
MLPYSRSTLFVSTTLAIAAFACLSGCNNASSKSDKATVADILLIAPEDLTTIHTNAFASGPSITGSVQPERKADLRAEISSVVLQVLKENGEKVKKGDLLVRLDDTSIRDSLNSAQESERAATQSLEQAQRQYERLKTLRGSGMASAQQVEDAEIRRNTGQSDLSAANTRTVQARQQLQRTEIRAPFDGIISERKVSNGDTAQIGKELVKVIDPTSMRFEGLVSADTVSQVKIGQAVNFRINGYNGQNFNGTVKRVNPEANPVTRQVEVLVSFSDSAQPQVSGLYAEGQIEAGSIATLMIPEMSIVRNGDKTTAWTVKDNAIHKTIIALGARDLRRGDYVVKSGLSDGDILLRNPSTTLKDGQKVDASNKPAAKPAAATTSATAVATSDSTGK